METQKVGMFEEAPGEISVTRVMFFVGLLWAMLLTTLGAFALGWKSGEVIAVFAALSGVFIGLKLGQKSMENQSQKIDAMNPKPPTA